ncbi:MAG: hypothetical protein PHI86_01555 [Candidatus Omnitrophica bacterium]|nr:hypothetical protein [Candidatus Omnitrophota bacterium]HOX54296.1 hypothetical protein [Candidatus Omnitrophota bacterium]
MIEWALVVGIAVGIVMLGQDLIKNSMERKMLLTSHYLMWKALDNPAVTGDEQLTEDIEDQDGLRTKTRTADARSVYLFGKHSGEIKSVVDPAGSSRHTENVNISVAEDLTGKTMENDPFFQGVPVDYKTLLP